MCGQGSYGFSREEKLKILNEREKMLEERLQRIRKIKELIRREEPETEPEKTEQKIGASA